MEAKLPDVEFIIGTLSDAMSLTDNKQRMEANEKLTAYEKEFPTTVYAAAIADSLMREELLDQRMLHLKT